MTTMIGSNGHPLDVFDPASILIDTVLTATGSGFSYETLDGNMVQIWGSGFTYDGDGLPVAGAVSVITIHDTLGNEIASFTLANVDLGSLFANGGADFWDVLFGGDDAIFAHDGDDVLSGFDGNDRLYGKGGDDELFGGQGNDVIDGGIGNDIIDAGQGDDLILFHVAQGNDTIDGGSGFDTVIHHGFDSPEAGDVITVGATRGRDPSVSLGVGSSRNARKGEGPPHTEAILDGVERLEIFGNDGDDALHVFDISNTDLGFGRIVFDGGLGTDDLHAEFATTDITYLWRFAGKDHPGDGTVDFGSGTSDRFEIVVEDDSKDMDVYLSAGGGVVEVSEGLFGGGSNGSVTMTDVELMSFDFAGGDDTVTINGDLSAELWGTVTIDFGDGTGTLMASDHQGNLSVAGGDGANVLMSGGGMDALGGGAAADFISGGAANDSLFGYEGEDQLFGGEGDDTLRGGADDDQLTGGDGADRFVFDTGFGDDTIDDFEAGLAGHDVLDFNLPGLTFADLAITQIGADTQIATPDGDTVLLVGVLPGQLHESDFVF